MNIYIEDNTLNIVMYAGTDPYIINNLLSGVLNCKIRLCDNIAYERMKNYFSLNDASTGLYFGKESLKSMSLEDYPKIQQTIKLLNLRAPAFKKLLELYNLAMLPNLYGFGMLDPLTIKHALKDNFAIEEYSAIMGLDSEFTKSELTLIADSILDDRFRIFSVCDMWKNKINNCYTQEDIDRLINPMKDSFLAAGVRNDV